MANPPADYVLKENTSFTQVSPCECLGIFLPQGPEPSESLNREGKAHFDWIRGSEKLASDIVITDFNSAAKRSCQGSQKSSGDMVDIGGSWHPDAPRPLRSAAPDLAA